MGKGYVVEDGRRGHTPYFYNMDVPVRVRNTISYGRGWQLLRSRGAGNNDTGACDPPMRASSCSCAEAGPSALDAPFPRCLPTALCGTDALPPPSTPAAAATILVVLNMDTSHLRFPLGGNLQKGYASQLRYIVRLCLSLAAVNTKLPISLLATGFRAAPIEQALAAKFGLNILDAAGVPPVRVPSWASKWTRASFSSLRALTLSQFGRLIVVHTDVVARRNIDHLAYSVPTPAFTSQFKCFPRRELRAALMVLRPDADAWRRAQTILDDETAGVYDDLGEQSVWRRLYPEIHELPAGYCALKAANFSAGEWAKTHVLHDPHLLHKSFRAGYAAAEMPAWLKRLDDETEQIFKEVIEPKLAEAFPPKRRRGRRKG